MDQGQNRAAEDARAGQSAPPGDVRPEQSGPLGDVNPEQSAAGRAGDSFTFPFPPREFADRGTKWLLSDPAHLRHVLRVVAPELSAGLDFERLEPVLTEEISQQLQQQVADRIFRVPYRDVGERVSGAPAAPGSAASAACTAATVVLMVEHQSTRRRLQRLRMLSYMVRLWDLERQRGAQQRVPASRWRLEPIIPLVFYTGSRRWRSPLSLARVLRAPAALKRFVPTFDLLFLPVCHTARADLRTEESAFGQVLRLMRVATAPPAEFEAELATAVPRLEALTEDDLGEWRRLLYYLQLMILHYRSPDEACALRPALSAAHQDRKRRKEIEAMGKTMAEALIEEGEVRGLARGEVCGRRLMLLNQLEAKFGTLPVGVAARVEALTLAELDALGVALIRAETLEELGLG